ncbi:MFS family permease [Geosmithia morbida]|uniref:MFS family permease n=1 Tax=Geosmithia morbida TaxID=1094350 RepID=A0A9P4YST0_9HYPO|nr:MFS family permease [Geosmithia morbida]KAF4120344.1 MFS family permease [Geosmithia morbida]
MKATRLKEEEEDAGRVSTTEKAEVVIPAPTTGKVDPEAWASHFESMDEDTRRGAERRLLRKVDGRLLPMLIIMYLLNFLDRSNLAQSRQGSLEADLGMTGTDFNLATSIFFVGYLLMQLPSNLLLTKVRPSLYLSATCCLWGVVSTCNAATRNFGQLIAVRFFLGFVEAPFFPGAIFLMSSWYNRAELTRRIAWLYSGNALANMFGGLLGAAILGNLDGDMGLASWRWLFIIEGVVAIAFAMVTAVVLPDYPHTTRWLSTEEKALAAWRLLRDVNEVDEYDGNLSVWQGTLLALKDYRLYLFVLLQHVSLLSQSFQYFFPSILGTLGYGKVNTLWLTAPVWFSMFLVSVVVTLTSAKTADRSLHIIGLMILSAVGNAICAGSSSIGARFFAMFLMPMGAVSAYQIILSWVANSFPRPLAKRSAAIAICNMVGNTATIYGSYMYAESTAPQYRPGGSADAAICVCVAALALALRYLHKWENRKLERAEDELRGQTGPVGEPAVAAGKDRRAIGFRYVY